MRISALLAALMFLASCNGQPGVAVVADHPVTPTSRDTVLVIGGYEILIRTPADTVRGDLLLLPGWDYNNRKWCDSTQVCSQAISKGLRIIAPQMARSIYATAYYPETRSDLKQHPTLTWLDSAITILSESNGIFRKGPNFVLGLSTGGRGVAMICLKRPNLFQAGAALSGDFNQAAMPADNLSTLVYGPYARFTSRWNTVDNPQYLADRLRTPLYLGHGRMDKVVPPSQTVSFAEELKRKNPDLPVQLHMDDKAGHNFSYWRSELPAVWAFFSRYWSVQD